MANNQNIIRLIKAYHNALSNSNALEGEYNRAVAAHRRSTGSNSNFKVPANLLRRMKNVQQRTAKSANNLYRALGISRHGQFYIIGRKVNNWNHANISPNNREKIRRAKTLIGKNR